MPANVQERMLRNFEEMEAYLNNPVEPTIARDAVRRITAPTLLLSREKSPPVWKRIEKELASLIPNAKQVVISGAAHGVFRTHAELSNTTVLEFLTGK